MGAAAARRAQGPPAGRGRAGRLAVAELPGRQGRQAVHRRRPPVALDRGDGSLARRRRLGRVRGAYAAPLARRSPLTLDKLVAELPFELRAIQIDGGSEFMAEFEAACQARGIALHVLPPRSPELNGRVERLHGTWRCEFYAVYDPPPKIDRLNPLIDTFAHRYNTYRPHDALGQITPKAYLDSPQAAETPPSQMR